MKGYLSLLLGSLVVVLMLAFPGNGVQAKTVAPGEGECDCPVTYVTGAEGNKWVADLFKSEAFKVAKKGLIEDGYKWQGANEMSVASWNLDEPIPKGTIMMKVPFINHDGMIEYAGFMYTPDGFIYGGIAPEDEEH
jgi:hypothetical protein